MLTLDYTLSLLNLQEVIVKKVTTNDKSAVIDIEMPKKHIDNGDFILCCASGNEGVEGVNGIYRNVP